MLLNLPIDYLDLAFDFLAEFLPIEAPSNFVSSLTVVPSMVGGEVGILKGDDGEGAKPKDESAVGIVLRNCPSLFYTTRLFTPIIY
jgi:hypothetical protein